MEFNSVSDTLDNFIPKVEGFSSLPYWDHKQWSWGFGTACGFDNNVKPKGSISRDQALKETQQHYSRDFNFLSTKIKVDLTANQWAAYLSFSYNEGLGNAENLINDINSNSPGLEAHWKKYIYASGQINNDLIARRNKEWNLWITS